jgi:hypothetical protein
MLTRNSALAVSGTIVYLYQDGRTGTAVRYTGVSSGNGTFSITLGKGHAMTGTYQSRDFTLDNCGRFLSHATQPQACDFACHGDVP